MILQVVSDLHVELRSDVLPCIAGWRDPQADLLVMAGDVCSWKRADQVKAVVEAVKEWPKVLLLAGNHEYYGASRMARATARLVCSDYPNISVVDEFAYMWHEAHQRAVIAGTMWFRESAVAALPKADVRQGCYTDPTDGRRYEFSDFRAISGLRTWVYEENSTFQEKLDLVVPGDVVVTHHLPSPRSTPAKFEKDLGNTFFVCNQEDVILARRPALWIHGHTHTPCEYMLGETLVVANPLGYRSERSVQDYRPVKIEI